MLKVKYERRNRMTSEERENEGEGVVKSREETYAQGSMRITNIFP